MSWPLFAVLLQAAWLPASAGTLPGGFFVPNRGQFEGEAAFALESPGLQGWLSAGRAVFRDLTVEYEGSSGEARAEGTERLPARLHYLKGDDPGSWVRDVSPYRRVIVRQLYRGIDLLYGLDEGRLKAEYRVAPGADPAVIRWRYGEAREVSLIEDGALRVATAEGEFREAAPEIYQERDGVREPVEGGYEISGGAVVGFRIRRWDPSRELVIDPVISFSTYLGGAARDVAAGVAVDPQGNSYVAGWTFSSNFPLKSARQGYRAGGSDTFVACLSASGTLVWATYLGGTLDDRALAVAVDAAGSVVIAGDTLSTNLPVAGAWQGRSGGGRDGFAARLDSSGRNLVYSTYLGGAGQDAVNAVAVDGAGNAHLAGETTSTNFPTRGAFQASNRGAADAFLSKLSPSGQPVYSTLLGGALDDRARAVAVDPAGNAYVAGDTQSADFPTLNPIQSARRGGQDAFLAKLAPSGSSLLYSTFLGGSAGTASTPESAYAVAADSSGSAFIAGSTPSADFPLAVPFQGTFAGGTQDGFAAKVNPTGTALVYSTYLGGSGLDYVRAATLTPAGELSLAGDTTSQNFPTASPLQSGAVISRDIFVARLSAAGTVLAFSTTLGGTGSESAYGLAADSYGNLLVAGETTSADFPPAGGLQQYAGYGDAFLLRLEFASRPVAVSVTPSSGTGASQTFEWAVSDVNGAADVAGMAIIINSSAEGAHGCYLSYSRAANTVSLADDFVAGWSAPAALGSASVLENGQCSLALAQARATAAGNTLTLVLPLTFKPPFAGARTMFLYAWDTTGLATGHQALGSWVVPAAANQAPAAVAVNPSSGSGTGATFSFVFSDGNGYADIAGAALTINAGPDGAHGCYISYNRRANSVSLANDFVTAWSPWRTLGWAGTLENGQCRIELGGSSAAGSGAQLTLSLALVFKAAFAGLRNVYLYSWDQAGAGSGTQARGTWTVPAQANAPPAAVSVTPVSGSGVSQQFTFTMSDPNGYADISGAVVTINGGLDGVHACYVSFQRRQNSVSLANDYVTGWSASTPLGLGGVIANGQCGIDAAASSSWAEGNDLHLTLAISFTASFSGPRGVYLYTWDAGGLSSGHQQRGTWTVPAQANQGPSAVSVTPAAGSGTSQQFQFRFADSNGYADIAGAVVIVNSTLNGAGACYISYSRRANALSLADDSAAGWSPWLTLGLTGAVENSQCAVNLAASGTYGAANDLTVSLSLSFKPAFAGAKTVYLYTWDGAGVSSGHQARGSWTVP